MVLHNRPNWTERERQLFETLVRASSGDDQKEFHMIHDRTLGGWAKFPYNVVGGWKLLTQKRLFLWFGAMFLFGGALLCAGERGLTHTQNSPHAAFGAVDVGDVRWTGGFWSDRFQQYPVMIDTMWDLYMKRSFDNFRFAAGLEKGEFKGSYWQDGDFYKWLETLAWVYGVTKDPKLDARMDRVIEVISKAQMEDGYIDTPIQIGRGTLMGGFVSQGRDKPLMDAERWKNIRAHEVYNFGHLITAGCVHYRATGKRTLLNIAIKAADNLESVFGVPKPELDLLNYNPPHIMGLVELYRTTGERKYLRLAQTILDMRGSARREGSDHFQTREPFRSLQEAYGHAVLGTYLFAGATDVYLETGEPALLAASERLWQDVVSKRLYITGGCTAIHFGESQQHHDHVHEAFGWDYDLPSATAYNETCANIGNAMWNWRLLTATGNARYAEIMELVWYNSLLSSINLEGTRYFYSNVLRWHGEEHKLLNSDWPERWGEERGAVCCPPNIIRTIAEMNAYAYGVSDDAIWVHLYGQNSLNTTLPDGARVQLTQETDYPWDGRVKLSIKDAPKREIVLKLRIPGWTENEVVGVRINGEPVKTESAPSTYLALRREWKPGDRVELEFPMKVRLVKANPKVEALRNQVAVRRGPIVYCLESKDLPEEVKVMDVILPVQEELKPRYSKEMLGGLATLEGTFLAVPQEDWSGRLYRHLTSGTTREFKARLIPYYAWCNRGRSEMTVWMPMDR